VGKIWPVPGAGCHPAWAENESEGMWGTFRKFVRRTGFLAYLLLFLVPASPARPQYRFFSWTTENGLPQNSIQALLQTRVARGDDVYYFTGEEFRCHVRFTIDQMTPPYPLSLQIRWFRARTL
jgi:hypothetical protein